MRSKTSKIFGTVLAVLFASPSPSLETTPSFNCDATRLTPTEEMICTDNTYTLPIYDRVLATLYSEALQRSISSSKERVTTQQRAWLKKRNQCADLNCLKGIYAARITALEEELGLGASSGRIAVLGRTPGDRIAFLDYIQDAYDGDLSTRNKYYAVALDDADSDVREHAAYGLRGSEYTARLIDVMTTDPYSSVRQSASDGLQHWLTDNGQATCQDSSILEAHFDQLLKGLRDRSTAQNTLEILSAYSDCCMSSAHRTAILQILTPGATPESLSRTGAGECRSQ